MNDLLQFVIEKLKVSTINHELIMNNLKNHVYIDSEDMEFIIKLIEEATANE